MTHLLLQVTRKDFLQKASTLELLENFEERFPQHYTDSGVINKLKSSSVVLKGFNFDALGIIFKSMLMLCMFMLYTIHLFFLNNYTVILSFLIYNICFPKVADGK